MTKMIFYWQASLKTSGHVFFSIQICIKIILLPYLYLAESGKGKGILPCRFFFFPQRSSIFDHISRIIEWGAKQNMKIFHSAFGLQVEVSNIWQNCFEEFYA